MSLKSLIKNILPASLLKWQKDLMLNICSHQIYHYLVLRPKSERLRKKTRIKVLFIAYTPSMWKVDSLYRAMKEHPRFDVNLLLVPNVGMQDISARADDLQLLRDYFSQKGYDYVEWCDIHGHTQFEKIPPEYDILFYPQPWPGIVPSSLDFEHNRGRLMIDCDYAFHSGNQNWAYNKWYQNAAWLDLYENMATYNLSCKEKDNRGINSVITGLPIVDEFRRAEYPSPWKAQATPCKKIIWAPHWTITERSSVLPPYSHFLEMADFMLQFAKANIGKMQFAFKPHPSLKKELYKHPYWGKEKTDSYYQIWKDGENTQLEKGEYVNLFMTSDALVHDSSSFCCEYMLTGKPVLFMVKNEERQVSLLNEMGRSAFYAQYLGYSISDLEQFLEKQVMQSNDSKKEERTKVTARYLMPPHGKTASKNIIQAILRD